MTFCSSWGCREAVIRMGRNRQHCGRLGGTVIGIQQDLPHSTWRPVVRHRSLPMSLNTPLDFSHCIQEYVSRSRQSRMSGPSFPETAPANAGPIVDSKPNLFVAGRLTAILNE